MNFWSIRLSYRRPPDPERARRWRENMQVGVVADRIEEAIDAAKEMIPEGADEVLVWGANHHGTVDVIKPALVETAAGQTEKGEE